MPKKKPSTIYISLLLVILLIFPSGCSLFSSKMQPICISSDPTGADVLLNGDYVGKTPVKQQIHRGSDVSILVKKEGYRSSVRSTHKELSRIGVLDVIGGSFIIIPFIGLASSGAWEQAPTNFSIVLKKEGS